MALKARFSPGDAGSRGRPLEVAAALIVRDGKVLIARRPEGAHLASLWEFPGGKVEPGESAAAALRREIAEELGTEVEVLAEWRAVRHRYPDREVWLRFFLCRLTGPEPRPIGCSDLAWAGAGDLARYEFPPADREVLRDLPALLAGPRGGNA